MITKEEFYDIIQDGRRVAAQPENLRCTCPVLSCEWRGRCRECIALHRYYEDHLPRCLHPMLEKRIGALANILELDMVPRSEAPEELVRYVKERDREAKA